MKQRRLLRFHGLRRPRIRQTWNKYNLFNLARQKPPYYAAKTFFQQKWMAKALTRGYHGEHIKEYQWERMFSRRPLSAVNMDPYYMAKFDGSEQAAGRGSGLTLKTDNGQILAGRIGPRNNANLTKPTPYMQQVFAPMERRLDISIFRALFASSARQARQFVIHGAVTVNGKKMTHPSYLLNPGDMFQVDIDRVMMATGKQRRDLAKDTKASKSKPVEEEAEAEADEASAEAPKAAEDSSHSEDPTYKHRQALMGIKSRAKLVLYNRNAKHKVQLRQFIAQVKETFNAARKKDGTTEVEMHGAEKELSMLLDRLTVNSPEPAERRPLDPQEALERKWAKARKKGAKKALSPEDFLKRYPKKPEVPKEESVFTKPQRAAIYKAIKLENQNAHDFNKPYATPWQPRAYMSPFAFIPRYLEVNQRICAAVYLRHPVARPGKTEVPTPFSPVTSQLAFNWYLRRG